MVTPTPDVVLYGMPGSLYTAKARSYLRKQGLTIEERVPGDPRFQVVTARIGRWIIPVAEFPDGALVQDSADIIDAVERRDLARIRACPEAPLDLILAHILDLFGGEGLLRPAMHYRWNFDSDNLAFLQHDFILALAPGADSEAAAATFTDASSRMRRAARSLGVTPETAARVEAAYTEFLHLLDVHLASRPYLLGAAPTLADYGLIAPLHAHLSRDPYPSAIMKRDAIHVWRWVERMTCPDDDDGEFVGREIGTGLCDTLIDLLRFVSREFLPEVEAMVGFVNAWLPEQDGDALGANPIRRAIGQVTFDWRGEPLTVGVVPYRLVLLQRIQEVYEAIALQDQEAIRAALGAVDLDPFLDLRVCRRVLRRENREWWE